jgi:hypothetical protein
VEKRAGNCHLGSVIDVQRADDDVGACMYVYVILLGKRLRRNDWHLRLEIAIWHTHTHTHTHTYAGYMYVCVCVGSYITCIQSRCIRSPALVMCLLDVHTYHTYTRKHKHTHKGMFSSFLALVMHLVAHTYHIYM